MNWDAVDALAQLVGAVAVVVTLAYLVVQLRQNTEALRSNAYQGLHNAEVELFRDLSQNKDLRNLYAKASSGIDDLEESEKDQWSWLSRQHLFLMQNAHFQWSKGAMDDDMWNVWKEALGSILINHRGMRQMARVFSPTLRPAFVDLMSEYVAIDVGRSKESAAKAGDKFYAVKRST